MAFLVSQRLTVALADFNKLYSPLPTGANSTFSSADISPFTYSFQYKQCKLATSALG